jgi:hypothetical protein
MTRRRRHPAAAIAAVLMLSACGLQQAGLDGAVSVAGPEGTTGGLVSGTTGLEQPGTSGDGTTGGATGTTGGVVGGTSGTTGGSTGGTGGVVGGTSGTTGGGSGTSGTGGGGTGVAETPGLTGQTVVSFVNVTGFDQLNAILPVNTASTGNAAQQAQVMAQWVNAHGGLGGKRMVAKVHDYNAQQASEVNDNNLCQEIADTDKALLAVLHGQIHASARDCYAAKKVLTFEGSSYGFGHAFYSKHSPYLWSPSYADYDQTSKALVASIAERKWLAGETKVGIVRWDDDAYKQIADTVLGPLLEKLGVEVVQASVNNSDIGAIENGIHAAAQTMIVEQVDHILFLGSAPLQPFFVQQNQQYEQFVYAVNSFDVPRYLAANFPRNMGGAIGIGFAAVEDVFDAQYAFPQPGLETTCRDIYKAAGVAVPGRYLDGQFNSKQAISYCESTLLLKKVADSLRGDVTPASFTAAAERLGTSFQAAQTFRTSFGPRKHTGAEAYREITYDAECECTKYTSGLRSLP